MNNIYHSFSNVNSCHSTMYASVMAAVLLLYMFLALPCFNYNYVLQSSFTALKIPNQGANGCHKKKSNYQTENIVNYASDFVTW